MGGGIGEGVAVTHMSPAGAPLLSTRRPVSRSWTSPPAAGGAGAGSAKGDSGTGGTAGSSAPGSPLTPPTTSVVGAAPRTGSDGVAGTIVDPGATERPDVSRGSPTS